MWVVVIFLVSFSAETVQFPSLGKSDILGDLGSALDASDGSNAILRSLNPSTISRLPPGTLNKLSPQAFDGLTPSQMDQLPPGLIGNHAEQQTSALVELLNGLSPSDLRRLPWETVAKGLSPKAMSQLNPGVKERMPWGKVLPNLPKETLELMDLGRIFDSMSEREMANLPWKDILTPALLARQSPETLNRIPWDDIIDDLNPRTMASLGPDFFNGMSCQSLYKLSAATVSYMSPETISKMDTNTLQCLNPGTFSSLSPAQVGAIHPTSFGSLPLASLNNLPPTSFEDLSPKQLQSLGPRKLCQIRPESLAKIPTNVRSRLSRDQQGCIGRAVGEATGRRWPSLTEGGRGGFINFPSTG